MFSKRGAAHIEMISAFLLFFTFVFFMLLILKPYDTTAVSGYVVSGMYDMFEKEAATNLTSVFMKADVGGLWPAGTCFYVQLPNNIFSYGMTESMVTNLADAKVSSDLNNPNLNIADPAVKYYKVAISPDFEPDTFGPCNQLTTGYTVGSLLERQVISYKSLLLMKNDYFNDYDSLKGRLGVPEVFDFAILVDGVADADMQGVVPEEGDVLANDYIAEVLLTNGTVVNARITFKVW
jgi:hypothetical protein